MKQSKAIRYLVGSLAVGGTERHLLLISSGLAARGWAVTVITLGTKNPLAPFFESAGVRVLSPDHSIDLEHLPKILKLSFLIPVQVLRLIRLFRTEKVPTHFFLPHAYLFGMMAYMISRSRFKVFMSRRSLNDYQKKFPFIRVMERFFHQHINAALGNAQAVVDQLIQEGIPPDRVQLIYNGIDTDTISQTQSSKQTAVQADTLIFCVANFIPYKGHRDLIEAIAWLNKRHPGSWHIVCFGRDDGILAGLQEYASSLGVSGRISWMTNETKPWEYMRPGDIGILPSHQEGFSNALLEMMACSLAVIATDVGGNAEALKGGVGVVVPPKSPEHMGEAILNLLLNNDTRRRLGTGAKSRVQESYSLARCIDQYEEFYRIRTQESWTQQ